MTTKAELEAELSHLKEQMRQRDASAPPPVNDAEPTAATATDGTGPLSGLTDVLKTHGFGPDDLESIWADINAELDDFTTKKPKLTAVGAFGLGFVLGRMSKK